MKVLSSTQAQEVQKFIDACITEAKKATCTRAKCGSVVVQNNTIIGRGHNSPPQELESQRRCSNDKSHYHRKVTDKTCCIHAEQRAILDALKHHPDKVHNARLYFMRVDENNQPTTAGQPYCTVCSKLALEVGITEFVLVHEQGVTVYDTKEYNTLSYNYSKN